MEVGDFASGLQFPSNFIPLKDNLNVAVRRAHALLLDLEHDAEQMGKCKSALRSILTKKSSMKSRRELDGKEEYIFHPRRLVCTAGKPTHLGLCRTLH